VIRTTRERDRWSLQTALIHLQHRETGRRVALMSMIHIGEATFYTRVNELIAEQEQKGGLILYEGLGQLSDAEIAALTPDERKVWEGIAPLTEMYRKLATALDLVAQPDAMTKPKPEWIRADLPLKRLLTLWSERRLPLLPAMEQATRALESAFLKRATRLLLLQEPLILSTFRLVRGWSPGLGRLSALLVDERNDAAMAAFDAAPSDREALIVYGAGHVPGLLTALHRRGYRERGRDWFTAHTEQIPFSDLLDVAGEWWRKAQASARPASTGRR
jgi:hypothetical protein